MSELYETERGDDYQDGLDDDVDLNDDIPHYDEGSDIEKEPELEGVSEEVLPPAETTVSPFMLTPSVAAVRPFVIPSAAKKPAIRQAHGPEPCRGAGRSHLRKRRGNPSGFFAPLRMTHLFDTL